MPFIVMSSLKESFDPPFADLKIISAGRRPKCLINPCSHASM